MQILYRLNSAQVSEAWLSTFQKNGVKVNVIENDYFSTLDARQETSAPGTRAFIIADDEDTIGNIKTIRSKQSADPIIVIKADKNSHRAIELINSGADDVILAPFNPQEIIARIRAILRRTFGFTSESITVGDIEIYLDGRDPEVKGDGESKVITLSKIEHMIFTHLALRKGRVVNKDALFNAVYGMDSSPPQDKVIDVFVCKLRKKIKDATNCASNEEYIKTVYGRGYMFDSPKEDEIVIEANSMIREGKNSASFVGHTLRS